MTAVTPHAEDSGQLPLGLTPDDMLNAEIERRVAARCQAEAFMWRFRLIAAETFMMGLLVGAAGTALHQAPGLVARAALLVAASCFASGMLLLGLSDLCIRLRNRLKKGARR